MSQSYRLSDKGRLDRNQKLTFTYDGQSYTAIVVTRWPLPYWPMA